MGKTTVIIPLGNGSKWDNNELRFALRSIEKHLTGFSDIMIAGDQFPSWLTGVKKIPVSDVGPYPAMNTLFKVITCLNVVQTESFLLSYDDVFLNKDYDARFFPAYYNGNLQRNNHLVGIYKDSWNMTYQFLLDKGFDTKSFGVHCPFPFNTRDFILIMKLVKNREPGYLYKSLYGNIACIQADYKKDIIVNLPLNLPGKLETLPFFSIRDGEVNVVMQHFLEDLYPIKSQWEQ